MATRTLNDYTCFDRDSYLVAEGDALQQVLNDEEQRNSRLLKIDVRKAIERHIGRKRNKTLSEAI